MEGDGPVPDDPERLSRGPVLSSIEKASAGYLGALSVDCIAWGIDP